MSHVKTLHLPAMPESYDLQDPRLNDWGGEIYREDSDIPIYVVAKPKPEQTENKIIVMYPPWSDGPNHYIFQRRAEVTASASNKLVFGVGNSGVEIENPRMHSDIKESLKRGDFSKLNAKQWDTIEKTADLYDLTLANVDRLAYSSLAAHIAANAAANAPKEVHLNSIYLFETTSLNHTRTKNLKGLTNYILNYLKHGSDGWSDYMRANPEWIKRPNALTCLAKQAILRTAGLTIYPQAIYYSKSIPELLTEAYHNDTIEHDCKIVILNGQESKISTTADNDRLAKELADIGFTNITRVVVKGGTHSMHDSMPEVDRLNRALEWIK